MRAARSRLGSGGGLESGLESARRFDTWVLCEEHEFGPEIRRYWSRTATAGPALPLRPLAPLGAAPRRHAAFLVSGLEAVAPAGVSRRGRLHQQLRFNLVHQATFCGFREPGFLWKLDAPFLWGPIGGTQNYPWRFLGEAGLRGAGE